MRYIELEEYFMSSLVNSKLNRIVPLGGFKRALTFFVAQRMTGNTLLRLSMAWQLALTGFLTASHVYGATSEKEIQKILARSPSNATGSNSVLQKISDASFLDKESDRQAYMDQIINAMTPQELNEMLEKTQEAVNTLKMKAAEIREKIKAGEPAFSVAAINDLRTISWATSLAYFSVYSIVKHKDIAATTFWNAAETNGRSLVRKAAKEGQASRNWWSEKYNQTKDYFTKNDSNAPEDGVPKEPVQADLFEKETEIRRTDSQPISETEGVAGSDSEKVNAESAKTKTYRQWGNEKIDAVKTGFSDGYQRIKDKGNNLLDKKFENPRESFKKAMKSMSSQYKEMAKKNGPVLHLGVVFTLGVVVIPTLLSVWASNASSYENNVNLDEKSQRNLDSQISQLETYLGVINTKIEGIKMFASKAN